MVQEEAGRLETTMQNIADSWPIHFPGKLPEEKLSRTLPAFITFNLRRKTISVTKSTYQPGKTLEGSPEGGYFTLLQNHAGVAQRLL